MLDTLLGGEFGALADIVVGKLLPAVLALVVFFVVRDWLRFRKEPGVGIYWPVLGHLPTVLKNMLRIHPLLRERSAALGHPPYLVMKCGIWEPPRWLTNLPEDIEHALKTNFENYNIAVGVRGEALRDLLGNGIFNSDGHTWLVQRKLAAREFNANRFRTYMSAVFNRAAQKLSNRFASEIAASPSGTAVVDVHQWFFTLTLDAFSEIAFGVDLGGLDGNPQPFISAFDVCQEQIFNRALGDSATWRLMRALNISRERKMREALQTIDAFVYSLMDNLLAGRRAESAAPTDGEDDLLRRLLPAAKREDGSYDRVLVRDMLLNLILAGRDTTAASMSWTMFELMQQPKLMDEVLEELQTCTGGATPNFDNVAGCHFMQACLSESQRLHPSVPFDPRTALADDFLPGCKVRVRKGDTVAYVNMMLGVNPKIWGDDAAEYKPSRWMTADGTCKKVDHFTFPAFHGGRRLCLGMDMANLEMKVVLGTLLRRFRFELVDGQEVVPGSALTLQMRYGVKATIRMR